jgi:hypothetical protein
MKPSSDIVTEYKTFAMMCVSSEVSGCVSVETSWPEKTHRNTASR